MKVRLTVIILVVCILIGGAFFAVNRSAKNKKDADQLVSFDEGEITSGAIGGAPSIGNKGEFFIGQAGLLEFLDPETGKSAVVCSKANCTHSSYASDPDTECEADVHGFDMVLQQGGNIYLIGHSLNNEFTDYVIYREDIDGRNRKKIADLPGTIDLNITECQAGPEYLLMRYVKTYELTDNGKIKDIDKADHGFVIYDIEKDETKVVSLGLTEMADGEDVLNIDGYTLYQDGFDACVTCYAAKNGKDKKKGEMNVHHISFDIANPDEYTDMIVCGREGSHLLYKHRKLFMVDKTGKLLYTDFSSKLSSEETMELEGVDAGVEGGQINLYGTDGDFLYYSVVLKEKNVISYYYCDLNDKKSSFIGDEEKYVIEGVTEKNIYFCYVDGSGEYIRKAESNQYFRENGLQAMGKERKVSASKASAQTVVWKIWHGSQEMFGLDENILNEQLKKNGKDYRISLEDYDYFGQEGLETLKKACEEGDIISLPYESTHTADALVLKGLVMPLDGWLENSVVQKKFDRIQWDCVRVDGKVYAIPSSTRDYQGAYFAFQKKYFSKKDLEDFDGTLDGICRLAGKMGLHEPGSIYLETMPARGVISDVLTGGSYKYGMCFPDGGGSVKPWFEDGNVRKYYRNLNELYQKKLLVTDMEYAAISEINDDQRAQKIIRRAKKAAKDITEGNFAIYIGQGDLSGKIRDRDDVYIIRADTRNETDFGNTVAISSASVNSEAAMDFLELLYTNRTLADLFVYGKEGDKYERRDGEIWPKNDNVAAVFDWNMELYNTYGINTVYHYTRELPAEWEYPTENDPVKNYRNLITYDSFYTGKLFDATGYEKVIRKLIRQEIKAGYKIYKAQDFEEEYDRMLGIFDKVEYRELAVRMNRQSGIQ